MGSRTLYHMFQETVRKHAARQAVGFKISKTAEYTYWTYAELNDRVRRFRRGLDALGLQKGERIAILAENRVEWAIADLAAQALGMVNVAPYSSLPAVQVAYIIRDSGARILVLSDAKQRAKLGEIRAQCPDLAFVVAMDGEREKLAADDAIPFEDIYARGESSGREDADLDRIAEGVCDDDVAMLIYTSGTTGDPKGAMLSHANMLQTPDAVVDEPVAPLGPEDVFLSFLPLSHITERVGGYYLPIRVGACIVYSQGLSALADEITKGVRPTAMLSVPRLWENMHDKAIDSLAKTPERQRRIAEWGIEVGAECVRRRSKGHGAGPILALKHMLAEKLVLGKLREKITGGRIRFCVSGGAPLSVETATFFLGIGIQILEGYGLSETNIIAINRPGRQRIGTVGNLLLHVETKLAADGEILVRGQGRMQGYYQKPDATAEAIDSDGWFHTGDIGELSQDGYLKITDRKKDIIVLANGKKVAPQPIEASLKQSPYIGEAVLFGDNQATVMAILVPAFGKMLEWAQSNGIATKDVAELTNNAEVQKLFKSEVDKHTTHLADFEKIKKFRLVAQPFGIDTGELTPTLKVKRKVVAQKYADLIAAMSR